VAQAGLENARVARFNALKNSPRSSILCFSANGIGKLLKSEKPTVAVPGPRSVLRPSVPNVPRAFSRNALVSNQRAVRSAVGLATPAADTGNRRYGCSCVGGHLGHGRQPGKQGPN